jgi:FkbM family methyltransferase
MDSSLKKLKKEYMKYLNATENVDSDMILDCIKHYIKPEIDYKDKVCLDLGGNIGGFTKIAIDNGAKAVYTVECDTRNFEKMDHSFNDEPKATIIHAAVSANEENFIKIFKGKSKQNHCSTSILKKSGFSEYSEVKNIHISELLNKYKPDIIKIDIEGAEYEILPFIEEYHPFVLFIELHLGQMKEYTQKAIDRLNILYSIGEIKSFKVFKSIGVYDCWFKK